jgi:hypothetical protein
LRGPQLELQQFDRQRLKAVTLKLRALYPAQDPEGFQQRLTEPFIDALIDHYTQGYNGVVRAVPRQFLKRLVAVMDIVDEHPDADPRAVLTERIELPPEERAAIQQALDPGAGFDLVDV